MVSVEAAMTSDIAGVALVMLIAGFLTRRGFEAAAIGAVLAAMCITRWIIMS